jgi:hypothetical protein
LTEVQKSFIYASEADMLNVALFGMRAKEWEDNNPNKKGNIRDCASTIELAILSNLEYYNSLLIKDGINQKERRMRRYVSFFDDDYDEEEDEW